MLATWIWNNKHLGLFQHLKFNILLLCEICNIRDPETSSTTVPNKIYLKESWIASLSLAMTILKIRNVIAKECICTTVAIHFCYLILFYFIVLLYVYIDYRIYSGQQWKRVHGDHDLFCLVEILNSKKFMCSQHSHKFSMLSE